MLLKNGQELVTGWIPWIVEKEEIVEEEGSGASEMKRAGRKRKPCCWACCQLLIRERGLSDLANKHTGCPVRFEFQIRSCTSLV